MGPAASVHWAGVGAEAGKQGRPRQALLVPSWRVGTSALIHPPCHPRTPLLPQLRFSLVHRLAKPSSKAGAMWVGALKEGPDGLYRCAAVGAGRGCLELSLSCGWAGMRAGRLRLPVRQGLQAARHPHHGQPTVRLCLCSFRLALDRRPQGSTRLVQLGSQYPRVVRVRADWAPPEPKSRQRAGGWALKTKRERILM